MQDLPEPPVPAGTDLRDYSWMPLDVARLRDSDLTAIASAEEFRAAVLMWCAAWHQVPAGSLPDDDRVLAHMAGFGRGPKALEAWHEVKAAALDGFVRCSDGRMYHPVVAEKALEAWDQKQAAEGRRMAHRDRMGMWRAKKASKRDGHGDADVIVTSASPCSSQDGHGDASVTSLTIPDQTIPKEKNTSAPQALPAHENGVDEGREGFVKPGEGSEKPGEGLLPGVPSPPAVKKPKPHEYPADFEQFWSAYPRQANKLDAFRAWQKAVNLAGSRAPDDADPKKVGVEALQKAAEAFAKARKGDDPQFIPHAATWLNKGGWEDVPQATAPKYPPGYVPMGVGG